MTASPEAEKKLPHVLLIEDDPDHALTLHYLLKLPDGQAYTVTTAFAFADAVAVASKADVILLDLGLPDAECREGGIGHCIEILKALVPMTPILVITGMTKDRVEARAKRAGAAEVFQKGQYTPEQLKRAMAKVLVFRDRKHPIEERLAVFGAKLHYLAEATRRKADSADNLAALTPEQIEEARVKRGGT